jgi:hypothetical protein
MKGCELKKCKDWNGEKCTYPGLFCKYDQADDYPEDAPLAPNGCVIFEGVTKEAHDKLKSDCAALEAKVKRLREALVTVIKKALDGPDNGHHKYCSAICGPGDDTWIEEDKCDCWVKDARKALEVE